MFAAESEPLIALAGSPNCGKTALFNALTGKRQKVANYPGVTVERKEGLVKTSCGKRFRVLDLPGTYSLDPHSLDEQVTRDVLLDRLKSEEPPQLLVAVADAVNLERNLSLILELKQIGKPIILALNMMDVAQKRGLQLNLDVLSKELGIPIVPTVAVKSRGTQELLKEVEKELQRKTSCSDSSCGWKLPTEEEIRQRYTEVDRILKLATHVEAQPDRWSERIDRIVLHPFWGMLLLGLLLVVIFQAVFTWAAPLQDMLEAGVSWLGQRVGAFLPEGPLQGLIIDGIFMGVGAVLVFLPQIIFLFFFILVLEDCGYLARAAFLMDRLMGKVGLSGRALIPLLSSFACAIPGIMATRNIQNPKDRLTTILVAPLMTCSARLPVYSLLIAAFIPNLVVWGPLRLQGLVMSGLYFMGIFSALVMAYVFKKTLSRKSEASHFLLELPAYKIPGLRNLVLGLYERSWVFIRRAGTVILSLSILLWFLASYPKPDPSLPGPAIQYSYAGKMGRALEPLVKPLGFDWKIAVALVPGFAAREVMVGALGTVYAIESSEQQAASKEEAEARLEQQLEVRLGQDWSLATALSLLVFYIFAPQCLSTLAVTRRETNSWRYPLLMLFYLSALAYAASFLTYQLVSHWMS